MTGEDDARLREAVRHSGAADIDAAGCVMKVCVARLWG
jgi:hypothetical protein